MRYNKWKVNAIIDLILEAAKKTDLGIENNNDFQKAVRNIKEEYFLIDRRKSSLPEYTSEILHDLLYDCLSFKKIQEKYHCSYEVLMRLLNDCAETDDRVKKELEFRKRQWQIKTSIEDV